MKTGTNAADRTRQLLHDMPGRRKAVLGILGFLSQAHSPEELREEVARIQAHDASSFSAGSYSSLLEEAGAIERLSPDGGTWDVQKRKPRIVEEDGRRFYQPEARLAFVWKATQAGLDVLAENDPAKLLAELVGQDGKYGPIFERILRLCDEDGRPIEALNASVDYDPLVQDPPLKASYFVERLEGAGGLAWDGAWHTTPAGHAWLLGHTGSGKGE